MVNILGADLPRILRVVPDFPGNVKLHLYGKGSTPEARQKIGHLIIKDDRSGQPFRRDHPARMARGVAWIQRILDK